MERDRLEFIQALRGLAALAVVLFHARTKINGPAYLDLGDRLFALGFSGVDLFFVISGFIMVHTTWDAVGGREDAVTFLSKRIARIWPVYVILMVAAVVATGYTHYLFATKEGLASLGKAVCFYPQSLHGPPFFGGAPNAVGWTLNYEFWFYLLFALSLLGGRYRWSVLVALFTLFLVAIPLAMTGTVHSSAYAAYDMHPAILNLAANPMIWEFLLGVGIGALYRSRIRIENRTVLAWLVGASVTAVLWQFFSQYRGVHGPTQVGAALAVMVLALAMRNKVQRFAVPRALVRLGDISFSLYLVHRIVQAALPRILPKALCRGIPFVLGSTVVALAVADLSWRVLERGLAERIRSRLLRGATALAS